MNAPPRAIERIVARLRRMDGIRWEVDACTVRVLPGDERGFEVAFTDHGEGSYTVRFDGWHEDFGAERAALECFAFGLTDACRLICWSRDGRRCRWTVEAKTEDGWIEGRTTGLLFFPIASADRTCLQNGWVRMDEEEPR